MGRFSWFELWIVFCSFLSVTEGQPQLICPHQPVTACVGDDVVLPCRLDPPMNASSRAIEWTRPGLDPEYIHVHQDGRLVYQSQNHSFRYRTVLFVDRLIDGNVSLKLLRVNTSDSGEYKIFIPSLQKEASVQLTVGEDGNVCKDYPRQHDKNACDPNPLPENHFQEKRTEEQSMNLTNSLNVIYVTCLSISGTFNGLLTVTVGILVWKWRKSTGGNKELTGRNGTWSTESDQEPLIGATEPENQADGLRAELADAVSMLREIKTELENQRDRVRDLPTETVTEQTTTKTEPENQTDRFNAVLAEVVPMLREIKTELENQRDRVRDLPTETVAEQTTTKTEPENQSDGLGAVLAEAVSMQMEIKTEVVNQSDRVRERLEEVEREREFNKQKLQAVENEITEKEKTFEKPEKLVSDKENFLKDQWKLDETKRDCERQLLNLDKLLEPIEGQIAWLKRKQGAGQV